VGVWVNRIGKEYPIPTLEAEALIVLRQGSIVEKVRYLLPWNDLAWEIDVFSGENLGLVLAEIELRNEHQPSNCRPGLARRSQDSSSTTTAFWRSVLSPPGRTQIRFANADRRAGLTRHTDCLS
jgi:CYTH domain-containing protein